MAETISQYQIAPFTTPQNGQPGDADQVRGNDNTVGTGHNSHDADSGVHFQSSLLANRPAAGTAGRKWYTTDTKRAYYDTGSAWDEFGYLPLSGGTITGAITLSSGATIGGNVLYSPDNTKDVGAAVASRPRTIYVGTSVVAGSGTATTTLQANGLQAAGATDLLFSAPAGQSIVFYSNATLRWSINPSGHLIAPVLDDTYDIGAAGATRPRTLYLGTSAFVGASKVLGPRQTGWTAATGTATRSTFVTGSVTLSVLAEHVKALIDDLTTHGLIGA